MGKSKDLSEFDKGQIVMARPLDQSISKTAALLGCSLSAVVSIYQKWSKEGTVVNRRQGHGQPKPMHAPLRCPPFVSPLLCSPTLLTDTALLTDPCSAHRLSSPALLCSPTLLTGTADSSFFRERCNSTPRVSRLLIKEEEEEEEEEGA
ncbi:hypothetical protein QTP86_026139, partial [Hemibagrus guttatus]